MYQYQAFQLIIQTELVCPELQKQDFMSSPDVEIVYGKVDEKGLDAPIKKALTFQIKKNIFWLSVPNIARFLVVGGRKIIIEPASGVDEDSIRLFLLGSCFGALLMQRGLFLLHGNAIQIGQNAISVVGVSGAGKSSLSASFLKRGYSILADDVCAINAEGHVIPSFPQIKLWADAAEKLEIDTVSLRKIRPNIEKYAVPLADNFCSQSLSLKLVYALRLDNKDTLTLTKASGIEKFKSLRAQMYRRSYTHGIFGGQAHQALCGQLANRIDLAHLTRPNSGYHLDKLVDFIESDLSERGLLCG
jgi:hypothetical protein